MKKNIETILLLLPVLALPVLAGCSSPDDDYQPAEPLKAGCQQVHFSSGNEETALLDPTNHSSYQIKLKVVRNTTRGALTVPVNVGETTTNGVKIASEVTFADGDSTSSLAVLIPDTAKAGQKYSYSVTLLGDEVDPYTYFDGGLSFAGAATVPQSVKLKCRIAGVLDTPWEETALDLTGGHYRIADFMHSGYALDLTIKNGKLDVSLPGGSPLYKENGYYGENIYWYDNDYLHLYPYGKEEGTDIVYFVILNSSSYNAYYPDSRTGAFRLYQIRTSTMSDAVAWTTFYFQIE